MKKKKKKKKTKKMLILYAADYLMNLRAEDQSLEAFCLRGGGLKEVEEEEEEDIMIFSATVC